MSQWPHDDPRSRAAFYGDPALGQIESQLIWVKPPFQMYYDGKPISANGFKFHRKAAPALLRVLNRIWDECGHDQAKIDKAGVSDYCGAYNPRKIRGREHERDAWSSHAYGAAIDINAKGNSLGNPHGNMPAFVVAAFDSEDFRWGGRYHGRPDWMHFEGVSTTGYTKPVGFIDNGNDDTSAEADENSNGGTNEPTKQPWYKKIWTWVSGGGVGALGIGGSWLSGVEPVTIAIILGFAFAIFCVVWFTKKGRGW